MLQRCARAQAEMYLASASLRMPQLGQIVGNNVQVSRIAEASDWVPNLPASHSRLRERPDQRDDGHRS